MQAWGMSEAARVRLWAYYRAGHPYRAISQMLGCSGPSVWHVVRAHGGIAPPVRRRARRTLSRTDREEISRGLARDETFAAIAVRLGRPTSTVSREVSRHGGAASPIERRPPTRARGGGHAGPKSAGWPRDPAYARWSPGGSPSAGPRSRSPAGSGRSTPIIQRCRSHTRRFTSACLCKAAAC